MHTSTATAFRNTDLSPDCSTDTFSTWKTVDAPLAANSVRDTVASYLAIVIIIWVAQREMLIPSTSGWYITCRQKRVYIVQMSWHVIPPCLLQPQKAAATSHLPLILPSDVSEKTSSTSRSRGTQTRTKNKAPDFETCNYFVEAVSPDFEPNRVQLPRAFFINEDKAR